MPVSVCECLILTMLECVTCMVHHVYLCCALPVIRRNKIVHDPNTVLLIVHTNIQPFFCLISLSSSSVNDFLFLFFIFVHGFISSYQNLKITKSQYYSRVPADNEILADFYDLADDFGDIVDCGDLGEVFTVLSENKKKSSENHKETKIVNKFSLEDMVESNRFESEKLEKGNFMTIKQQNQLKIMRTEEEDTVKTLKERKSYVKKSKKLTSQKPDPGLKKRNPEKEASPLKTSRTNSISKITVPSPSKRVVMPRRVNRRGGGLTNDLYEGSDVVDDCNENDKEIKNNGEKVEDDDDLEHGQEQGEEQEQGEGITSPCDALPLNYSAALHSYDDANDDDSTDSESAPRHVPISQNIPRNKALLPNAPLTATLGTTSSCSNSSSSSAKTLKDRNDDVTSTVEAYWNEDPESMDVVDDVTHRVTSSSSVSSKYSGLLNLNTNQAIQSSKEEAVCVDQIGDGVNVNIDGKETKCNDSLKEHTSSNSTVIPTVKSNGVTASSEEKKALNITKEKVNKEEQEDEMEFNEISADSNESTSYSTFMPISTPPITSSKKVLTQFKSKENRTGNGNNDTHVVSVKSDITNDIVDLTDDVIEDRKVSRKTQENPSRKTSQKTDKSMKKDEVESFDVKSDEMLSMGERANGVRTSPLLESVAHKNKNVVSLEDVTNVEEDICDNEGDAYDEVEGDIEVEVEVDVDVDVEVEDHSTNGVKKTISSDMESLEENMNIFLKSKEREESIVDNDSRDAMDVVISCVEEEEDKKVSPPSRKDTTSSSSSSSSSSKENSASHINVLIDSASNSDIEEIKQRKSSRLNGGSEVDKYNNKDKDKELKKKKLKIGRLKQRGISVKDKSERGGLLSNSSDSDDYDDFENSSSDDDEKARDKKIPKKSAGNISKNILSSSKKDLKNKSNRAFESDDDDDDGFELDDSDVEVLEKPLSDNNNTPRNELEERINADWERSRGKSQSQASINFFAPRGTSGSSSQTKKPLKLSKETKQSDQEIKRLHRDKRAFKFFEGTNGTYYVHTHTHTCTHTYTCIFIYTYASTYIYIHTHIMYIHMSVRANDCTHSSLVQYAPHRRQQ